MASSLMGGADELIAKLLGLAKAQRPGGAGLDAARLGPAVLQQMGAAGALLRNLQVGVPEDHVLGARVDQLSTPLGLLGIDDHKSQLIAVDAIGSEREQRAVVAVVAEDGGVQHPHHGHPPPFLLVDATPELSGHGLRLSYGAPVVVAMLVLAGNLAVIAPVALIEVDDEGLHRSHPSSTR